MEDYHAYLEKLRLERIEKDRRSLERWNEVKHLYVCDVRDLSDRVSDMFDITHINAYRVLVKLLADNFNEGEHYYLKSGANDNRRRYKLMNGVTWKLSGIYLKWRSNETHRVGNVTISKIQNAYKDVASKREFSVRIGDHSYRVDLYFRDYRIAVECDEKGHRNRNKVYERERQEAISEKLRCTFVRYNPHAPDFDIEKVIREIGALIDKANSVKPLPVSDGAETEDDDIPSTQADGNTGRLVGHMDPGWLNVMPSRRHYNSRLWYLTPYGEQVWPYEVPYGIYPPNGYVKPNPMLPRPPGAGVADHDLIRREAIAANRYGRGPWPGLPDDSPIKFWLVAECNLPGSTKPVILGTITGRLTKTYE